MEKSAFIHVSGIPITRLSQKHILEIIQRNITGNRSTLHVSITNTESSYYALRNQEHNRFIHEARISLCDGIGVVLAALVQGKRVSRYHGPQFMLDACEYGVSRGWRHFLCGGKNGVAEMLADELKNRYPGLIISGTYTPPFREVAEDEEVEMIEAINRSRSDFVWVGLGLLKQERWIGKYKDRLNVPWFVGVGAAFDFHAGTALRAPGRFQVIGLEWLYRLLHEPRMLKRNLNSLIFLLESPFRRASSIKSANEEKEHH